MKVYKEHHIALTGISVYSVNARDGRAKEVREQVGRIVFANPHVMQMHGFYLNEEEKRIRCDVVVSFDAGDRYAVYCELVNKLKEAFPEYTLEVALDTDYSLES